MYQIDGIYYMYQAFSNTLMDSMLNTKCVHSLTQILIIVVIVHEKCEFIVARVFIARLLLLIIISLYLCHLEYAIIDQTLRSIINFLPSLV